MGKLTGPKPSIDDQGTVSAQVEEWEKYVAQVEEELRQANDRLDELRIRRAEIAYGARAGSVVVKDGKRYKVVQYDTDSLAWDKQPWLFVVPYKNDGSESKREQRLLGPWKVEEI